jgi:hypothetical protein
MAPLALLCFFMCRENSFVFVMLGGALEVNLGRCGFFISAVCFQMIYARMIVRSALRRYE